MPYAIIKGAIERKESLTGKYDNYLRHFSPHVLGDDRHGNKAVIGFQYGGGRQGGLPIAGDWCCFQLNGLSGLRFNGDRWVIGPIDRRPMHLLSTVEVSAA